MDSEKLKQLFTQFNAEQTENKNRDSRVLIVDGLNLFIRNFSANPVMNHRGDHVGGLIGFIKSLFSLIRKFRPTRCVLVFDGKNGSKRRREKFPDYKSGRKNRDSLNRYIEVDGVINEEESLLSQFERLEYYLHVLPLTMMSIDFIEADDTISYIVNQYYGRKEFGNIVVVSSDKDFLQLVKDGVQVWSPTKQILYDEDTIRKEYNFLPKNYLTYRTLTGDASDNIPGIRGMGLKTILKCFPEFTDAEIDVDAMLEIAQRNINEGSKRKIYSTVLSSADQLTLNWELMQLTKVDIPGVRKNDIDKLMDESVYRLDKHKFKQLIYEDGLNDHFKYIDSMIYSILTQLDMYAES